MRSLLLAIVIAATVSAASAREMAGSLAAVHIPTLPPNIAAVGQGEENCAILYIITFGPRVSWKVPTRWLFSSGEATQLSDRDVFQMTSECAAWLRSTLP